MKTVKQWADILAGEINGFSSYGQRIDVSRIIIDVRLEALRLAAANIAHNFQEAMGARKCDCWEVIRDAIGDAIKDIQHDNQA